MPHILSTNPSFVSRRQILAASGLGLLGFSTHGFAGQVTDAAGHVIVVSTTKRIVSIGSASTEILVELGFADNIVAIDSTSKGVLAEGKVPDIGYMRALAAEGILAQTPDLIVATMDSGPKEVIEALRASGVPLLQLPVEPTVNGIITKISMLGVVLDVKDKAGSLSTRIKQQADDLSKRVALVKSSPKALFILGMGGNRLTVGGAGTAANAVLEMAGAQNIAKDLEGYKPFSPELVVATPPDVVVMMVNGGHEAAVAKLYENAALAATPAAKNKAVFPVDGAALLSFGTRTLDQAVMLAEKLHGKV